MGIQMSANAAETVSLQQMTTSTAAANSAPVADLIHSAACAELP
jgi:hypothetical protein